MEFFWAVLGIVALVVAYFCFGIAVKFLLGWWILVLGTPVLFIVGIALGWIGTIVVIAGLITLIAANNRWHDSKLYLALEQKVDRAFYLSDT